jgi:hypothetical protein
MKITNTADIISIFPNLQKSDKFKNAIDVFLKIAKTPITIDHCSLWKGYECNGITYRTRINNGKKAIFIQKVKIINTSVTQSEISLNPLKYRSVADARCGQISLKGGEYQDIFTCRVESVEDVSWSKIASIFGKLLKDEIENISDIIYVSECSKCNGLGKLAHYAHIAEGLCFQCMGIGKWLNIDKYNLQKLK